MALLPIDLDNIAGKEKGEKDLQTLTFSPSLFF